MKPIELTESHKAKLLEMCKALFPEYEQIEIRDYNDNMFPLSGQEAPAIFLFPIAHKFYEVFHWFEFCLTHLAVKILSTTREYNEGKSSPLEDFRGYWCDWGHPVDYLYKEFKTHFR